MLFIDSLRVCHFLVAGELDSKEYASFRLGLSGERDYDDVFRQRNGRSWLFHIISILTLRRRIVFDSGCRLTQ